MSEQWKVRGRLGLWLLTLFAVLCFTSGVRGATSFITCDGLDRLTAVSSPMFTAARYEYDALDNLKRVTIGGTSGRDHWYCHDASNRLTNVKTGGCATGASVIGLGYDAQGNLTNKNGALYTFSQDNRLRAAVGKETYRYDAAGRRVTADSPTLGKNRSFYNRDGTLAFRHDGRRQMSFAHVYLAGSLVATREQSTVTAAAAMKYHHTDALGTPVATTDASRNVVERSEYEPYGKLLNRPANDGPGYTGHVEDAQTGLVYMQQRYYDALCGCFISVDPMTPYSSPGFNFNRYWYANNSPYKFVDPDGRLAFLVPMAAGAVIGASINLGAQLIRSGGNISQVRWGQVGVAAGAGALGGGAGVIASTASTATRMVASNAVAGSAIGAGSANASAALEGKSATVGDVAKGAIVGAALSGAGGAVSAAPGAAGRAATASMTQTERVATENLIQGIADTTRSAGGSAGFAPAGQGFANSAASTLSNVDNLAAQPEFDQK